MRKFIFITLIALIIFSTAYAKDNKVQGSILDGKVNGNYEDYNAFIIYGAVEDTLFFTSSRPVPNRRPIALSAEMFYSTRPAAHRLNKKPIDEGWSKAKQIKAEGKRIAMFTRGTQTLAPDRIIFAAERDMSTIDASGTSYLFDLWEMTRRKDGFSLPKPIDEVNDPDAWDSQPALSLDGKILVFTTNRAGGKGGLDLWYSVRNINGKWTRPKLVPNINTPGNETSPHFGADGKFYFSTDWDYKTNKKGTNRKDIFRADFVGINGLQMPSHPVNLDEALRNDAKKFDVEIPENLKFNSAADDEFPFITPDRAAIFITSNRDADFDKRNIFAYSLPKSKIRLLVNVTEKILDSKGGLLVPPTKKYGLELNLSEQNTGKTSLFKSGIPYEVEANKTYKVSFNKFVEEECYQNKVEGDNNLIVSIPKPFGLDTMIVRNISITRQKVEIPPIIFHSTDTLPYFITGYWYPNTTDNLKEYRNREANGFFDNTGFVDSTGHNYDYAAKIIDQKFYKQIYKPLLDKLPAFQDFCRDTLYLKITIHGYTDPRGLSAGESHPYRSASRNKRNYTDKSVQVGVDANGQPLTIPQGLDMWKSGWPINPEDRNGRWAKLADKGQNGNIVLSKLRAYFTFVTFDKKMQEISPIYKQMRNEGRIIIDAEGFGIDKKGFEQRSLRDDPQSRRIEIYIDILRPEEIKHHHREAGGKLSGFTPFVSRGLPPTSVSQKRYNAPRADLDPKATRQPNIPEIKDNGLQELRLVNDEMTMNKRVLAPLEPEVEQPSPELYSRSLTSCYTLQFATFTEHSKALAALNMMKRDGLDNVQLNQYIDPFGNPIYRLRYGCFETAEDAVFEMKNLRWVSKKLHTNRKPAIIKERR